MTWERKSSHTLTVRFSRRPLPWRHTPNGSPSLLLPKAALPGPERLQATPWTACVLPAQPTLTADAAYSISIAERAGLVVPSN
jgi:hypothetical protein